MPGRKEFEQEYENDADQIIKDIEFLPEDTAEDTALKCAVLSNYNIILDRRLDRKSFIFERGLTDFKKVPPPNFLTVRSKPLKRNGPAKKRKCT